MNLNLQCVAFDGAKRIASGELRVVAPKAHKAGSASVVIFDDATSEVIDIDFSGSSRDLMRRLERSAPAFASNPATSH